MSKRTVGTSAKKIRTRFAPSPTGFVHVGSLRAALFPYLFAKKNHGAFILRIEDTDQERSVEGRIENIIRTLEWAGIIIDEGPRINDDGSTVQIGNHGPYIQSERLPIYQKYVQELLKSGLAYYAFDTTEELEAMRERQQAMKQAPKYDRLTMRNQLSLDEQESKRLLAGKTPAVIRLKIPENREVVFTDLVRGEIRVQSAELDDQVLLKSDGFPTYHLAVVVDDHLMEITHVIRGEDWLPSTPKHILLYEAFGWELPAFAHLPLLVNVERQKLSKRKGDAAVENFRMQGYLPGALVNFLAFLGWNPGNDQEILSLAELIQEFSLAGVQKAPAVFNVEKLNWYNQQYIRSMDMDELLDLCIPFLFNAKLIAAERDKVGNWKITPILRAWLKQVIGLVKDRIVTLADLPAAAQFLLTDTLDYPAELLPWKNSTASDTANKLQLLYDFLQAVQISDWRRESLEKKVGEWIKKNEFGVGDILWPMRAALSGEKQSPGPYELAAVLGKEKTLHRLLAARSKLET